MISGLDPWEPLFMDLNIPNHFSKSKKIQIHFKNNMLLNLENGGTQSFGKRQAPTNDEDPPNKFLRILDIGSIST